MAIKLATSLRDLLSPIIALLCFASPALGCTDFQIKTADGAFVCGRSMEWGTPLRSKLRFHQRGESVQSQSPSGKPGQKWTSRYGYVAADAYDVDTAVDGMNEEGLVFSALWLPGTVYQQVPAGSESSAIDFLQLGSWVLGNFKTVDEAVAAIQRHYIWCSPIKEMGGTPTLHIALHDAKAANAVIEFIDGQQKIYDNPNGVLTNAPTFDWHQTNLRNYIHIDAANPKPVIVAGTVLAPPGQGSGFLGIPGDWTPPSRFVRATAMLAFAKPAPNADAGVTLAAHILNAVDIPKGAIRENSSAEANSDYTQWAIIKNVTAKKLYYRSYNDLSLRVIDLSKIDWSAKQPYRPIDPTQ